MSNVGIGQTGFVSLTCINGACINGVKPKCEEIFGVLVKDSHGLLVDKRRLTGLSDVSEESLSRKRFNFRVFEEVEFSGYGKLREISCL
ncbi:4246_t:CDS:2 [Racocetra fulgida]|uniref:4246_t:CDS:1 n=1 Tax=Racocetra fulgida TaxID=60492 RepID=A0A9N9CIG5_9GLOM|nr:4246_t:CDS:2 [Racocetra fulgida]